jgi:hypothetical protein
VLTKQTIHQPSTSAIAMSGLRTHESVGMKRVDLRRVSFDLKLET